MSSISFDTVVWDWNGTLLDDLHHALAVVNGIFDDHGVDRMSPDYYRSIFDFPVQAYYARAGLELCDERFAAVSERFNTEFEAGMHNTRLFDAAVPILEGVRLCGHGQYLLSGTEHARLERMIGGLGLDVHFDEIKGMDDGLAHGKVDGGRELLDATGMRASSTLLIGDTTHDWEVAEALGMRCVLLATGHQSHERLSATGVPVFDSLEELAAALL